MRIGALFVRGGKQGSTLAQNTEAKLKRIHTLPCTRRKIDEDKAWRPWPKHNVVQVHVGVDNVVRVEHPEGRTHVAKQLRQVLLCEVLKGEPAEARRETFVPGGIDLRQKVKAW